MPYPYLHNFFNTVVNFFNIAKPTEATSPENKLSVPVQKSVVSSPNVSPGISPIPRSSSIANLQTASKLILSSRLVYSQPLDLPAGVEVIRATPSAGKCNIFFFYLVCPLIYFLVYRIDCISSAYRILIY